ncbi:hypothetical protein SKAU_G00137430 [Synaphobranchus kaupii]|uniref:Uncharacterized protein n=1 Tax=Synaphobranchus kaupii TaxID=118154 RepID=A0A9Q1FRP3_SYNKA|nr:hypothetical protein SKAU_G00137430 [Synaphobranchus kaupii]
MSLLEWLQEPPFQAKEPQDKSRKTVAAIQEMPLRKPIGVLHATVCQLKGSTEVVRVQGDKIGVLDATVCQLKGSTEVVRVQGDKVEVQTCYAEDTTGRIKLQLWGDQIGTFSDGCSYNFTNLSTREFARKLFLTTTRKSTILQMPDMQGIPVSETASDDEQDNSMVTGHINAADSIFLYSCPRCHTRQPKFDTAMCNGTIVVMAADGKRTLTISNYILQRYLDHKGVLQLMPVHKDVEEHFLDSGQFQFKLHNEHNHDFSYQVSM